MIYPFFSDYDVNSPKVYQGNLKFYKCSRTISKVSQIVAFVLYVVANHHMPLANSCCCCWDYIVIQYLPICSPFQRSDQSTPIVFVPQRSHQSTSINSHFSTFRNSVSFKGLKECKVQSNLTSIQRMGAFLISSLGTDDVLRILSTMVLWYYKLNCIQFLSMEYDKLFANSSYANNPFFYRSADPSSLRLSFFSSIRAAAAYKNQLLQVYV